MAEAKKLEVIHNTLIDIVFISTDDLDECDTSEGPHGILFHRAQTDQSPRSVTITGFKASWANARNEITQAVSAFLKVPRQDIEKEITATLRAGLC